MTAKSWKNDCFAMIKNCEAAEGQLSAWEVGFLDSIRRRLEEDKPLTQKQTNALNSIWEQIISRRRG